MPLIGGEVRIVRDYEWRLLIVKRLTATHTIRKHFKSSHLSSPFNHIFLFVHLLPQNFPPTSNHYPPLHTNFTWIKRVEKSMYTFELAILAKAHVWGKKYTSTLFSISNFKSINFTYLMLKWIGWKVPATANFHFSTYFSYENNSIFPFFSFFFHFSSRSTEKLSPNIFAFTSIACMLMEIVCFLLFSEIGKWKKGNIGLEFDQSIS